MDHAQAAEALAALGNETRLHLFRLLVKAHEYWRLKGLEVDLVVLNDHPPSYASELQNAILQTVQTSPQRGLLNLVLWIARVFLWRQVLSWLPDGKRVRIYSINAMRARHPDWFLQDLGHLFDLLAKRAIQPHVVRAQVPPRAR